MKYVSLGEAETKRRQAVDFLRRIGNDDAADEYEAMSPEDYAATKGVVIVEKNPEKRKAVNCMAGRRRTKTKEELQEELDEAKDQLDEANGYIEDLEAKLDDIGGIVSGDEEEEEEDDEEEEDEEE